jgi:SAM-dependent methyltransferase
MTYKQPINELKLNELVEHAFYDLSAGYMGVMISIGHKLGLYRVLAGRGPLTAREVAEQSGCDPRYVAEWLNSQVAGGYADYHPDTTRYELTPEQAVVLADEESPYFMPHAWNVPASMWFDEDKTLETFRTGEGLSWGEHDARLSCGSAAFFRNGYQVNIVQSWLPSLDGVVEKLERGAKVADIGCGHGYSTIIMAQAYPESEFFGFDGHEESINEAQRNALAVGVADRVHFDVAGAANFPDHQYDLICYFDALHDMGDPVGAARYARSALADDGTVMLVEPYAGDKVEDNINPVGRLFYAASTTICCAHSKSEDVGLALGAQAGQQRLNKVFTDAGFRGLRRAMETPFNLVLEARA